MSLSINPLEWPSVSLNDRKNLPSCTAIYFAIDANDRILYVGKAKSLMMRWRNHHRLHKLEAMHREIPVRLAWQAWSLEDLDEAEKSSIQRFHPLLNQTAVESPVVVPSEVVLRDFLKAFSRRLLIMGIEPRTAERLPHVHLKYDWQDWSARGTAAKIKAYIQQHRAQNTSLKFKRHRHSKFEDFAAEVFRPGSRAQRTTARQHRAYNNHWEFACNGVIFHVTPTDNYRQHKMQTQIVKLARINFHAIAEVRFLEAQINNDYEFVNLFCYTSDPVPLLWGKS
jgi:predicted GIY-YIG superfamily endonuclease